MIKIYGASDDLISIEGDIVDEISGSDDFTYLATSNGYVVRIYYSRDGIWEARVIRSPVNEFGYDFAPAYGEAYSDVVTIHGPVEWIVAGRNLIVC